MRTAFADIGIDCEFQDDDIVQRHAVILNFLCRSPRAECPLLANHLSPFASSNATAERKFLRSGELRFLENKLNACLMFVGTLNVTRMICRPASPARQPGFAIRIEDVLYGCAVRFRGDSDPGDCFNPEPFIAGRSTRVMLVSQNRFPHCCSFGRGRRPQSSAFLY